MYDLKTQFDVSRFVGTTLELVCFAKYQFSLHFSSSMSVSSMNVQIEGQPWYSDLAVNPHSKRASSNQALLWIGALQTSVIQACVENENDFCLTFENGFKLTVEADRNYESYHITADGKTVIV